MDRGAWWAAVHGVAESQIQLSILSQQKKGRHVARSLPCEDTARRQPPASQEEGPHQEPTQPAPDLGTPGLP